MRNMSLGLLVFSLGVIGGIVSTHIFKPTAAVSSQNMSRANSTAEVAAVASGTRISEPDLGPQRPTLAEINGLISDFDQSLALYELLEGMDASEVVQLIDEASRVISGNDYLAATSIMFGRLAELDLETALEQVSAAPPIEQKRWTNAIFHAVARLDLSRAIDAAKTLPRQQQNIAALALLRSRDDLGARQRQEIATTFQVTPRPTFTHEDPSIAWQEALQEPGMQQRMMRLMSVATQWVGSDPLAALAAVEQLPRMYRQGIQAQLLAQWAQNDFDSAWAWLEGLPPSPAKKNLFQAVIGPLARNDIVRARSIVNELPVEQQLQAMSAIAVPWAKQDLQGVVSWLTNEVPKAQRDQVLSQIAMRLSMQDAELAEQFAELLPEQDTAMMDGVLVSMLGNQDPQRAAVLVDRMTDPQRKKQAAASLVRQWADGDREGAVRWIEQQEPAERGPLYGSLTTAWAAWDPDGALIFARSLPDAGARDEALAGVVRRRGDIGNLLQVYEEIENPDIKSRAARSLYRVMLQNDPERAEAFRAAQGIESGGTRAPQVHNGMVLKRNTR